MDSQTIKWLVFNGKAENYPAWSTKFTAYMQTKGLYKALLGKEVAPEEIAPLAGDASDEQKAEWEAKVQQRNKQIEEIKERNNTMVLGTGQRRGVCYNRDIPTWKSQLYYCIINGLPEKYEHFIVQESFNPAANFTELRTRLQNYDDSRLQRNQTKEDSATVMYSGNTSGRNKGPSKPKGDCFVCGNPGHFAKQCSKRSSAYCSKCKKKGHLPKACRGSSKPDKSTKEPSSFASYSQCMNSGTETSSGTGKPNHLIFDTGCTDHIISQKELFENLQPCSIKNVKDPKGNFTPVEGIGDVPVKMYHLNKDDVKRTIGCEDNLKEVCETCALGKQSSKPVPKETQNKSQKARELVYSDILGPFEVPSLSGSRYAIIFNDEYSKHSIVKFMSKKSQAFEKFKEYVAEYGIPQRLRTDNGAEYTSKQFMDYCRDSKIKQEFTVPETPQQNGVAERFNRTVVEMGRSVLIQAKLPKCYWVRALSTGSSSHTKSYSNCQ
ncbi:Retrovirus-related Pol poly from transposon TNT 1-94 [Paramuricea clavata]|uniref:Retrovirus-related Pol poly from transposon TNT 1-94 n=1 Tax=Paramuricea clavata TaxID=317549 RepID=A0A7D9E5R5_PARCT|nr:Retrovirus-related Pol poly from transposon TNT 1-94 [Paramuricea clavata]